MSCMASRGWAVERGVVTCWRGDSIGSGCCMVLRVGAERGVIGVVYGVGRSGLLLGLD